MLSFAMISQRRILSLIHLFTMQGATLVAATVLVGYATAPAAPLHLGGHHAAAQGDADPAAAASRDQPSRRALGRRDADQHPDDDDHRHRAGDLRLQPGAADLQAVGQLARGTLGIALACVLLSFMMMITRSKAVPQVIGFLSMENGLFFAATSATYGMPMVVELGIALDVLVGILILGVFMFHIREQFDSLDISHLEKLKED
jgi:hydrogenase-4 component E